MTTDSNPTSVISVQVQKGDASFVAQLESIEEVKYTKLHTASFDGQSEIITLVITLTPAVLVFLAKLITEQIRARRYIKVIYKGVQIQGIDEKNAIEVLRNITGGKK